MTISLINVQPISVDCDIEGCPNKAAFIIYVGDDYHGQYCAPHKDVEVAGLEKALEDHDL